jgi:hypothetical protein
MHLGEFSLDTFYDKAAAMFDDDTVTDAQSQARAQPAGFGRKERLHDVLEQAGRDADP